MYPYLHIFGKLFSSYGALAFIGLMAGTLYLFILHKIEKDPSDFFIRFLYYIYASAFGGLTAAVFFHIVSLKQNLPAFKYLFTDFHKFLSMFNMGIVFYGGMFGIYIGMMVYSKYFKEDTRNWVRTSIVTMPLFHAFGRVGCAAGGCCYGVVGQHAGTFDTATGTYVLGTHDYFAHSGIYNARIGAYCFPVQLIETVGLLVIFVILNIFIAVQKNKNDYYKSTGLYFVLYGILRFILEFYRGDTVRGLWGPFSTSQYVSMIVVPLGIYCLVCPTEKNFMEKMFTPGKKKEDAKKSSEN